MTTRSGGLGAVVLAAILTWAPPSIADDGREADRLFAEGKALMDRGSFAAACSRFEASLTLQPGIGARLWLGDCYESMGRVASAQKQFRIAAEEAAAAGDRREQVALKHAELLEPRVVKIAIKVESPAPGEHADLDGISVPIDVATPVAVDAGRHVVTVTALERTPWTLAFDASSPDHVVSIDVPPLALLAPVVAPPPPPKEAPSPPVEVHASPWRTVGYVGGGVGILGLATSGVLALLALDSKDASKRGCDATSCTQEGNDDGHRAVREANAATIAFVAGAALLAGGIILVVVSPTASSRVALSPSGVSVSAAF